MSGPYDWAWQQFRLTILDRDRHTCQINGPRCTHHATHVDHIIPLAEGGARLDPNNCRAACRSCNIGRNTTRQAELARYARTTTQHTPTNNW